MTDRMNNTDFLQIEDTPEFANFECERDENTAGARPGSLWSWGGRGGFADGFPDDRGADPIPSPATPAEATPDIVRPDDINEVYVVPESDDAWDSKIPLLSEAQWAKVCAELGIDPSFQF